MSAVKQEALGWIDPETPEAAEAVAMRHAQIRAAYQRLFAQDAAETVLEDLIDESALFKHNIGITEFDRGVVEGKRRLMLRIAALAELAVTDLMKTAKLLPPERIDPATLAPTGAISRPSEFEQ